MPYSLIIGEKEAQGRETASGVIERLVSVRNNRSGQDLGQMSLTELIQRCQQEISTRGASPATAG